MIKVHYNADDNIIYVERNGEIKLKDLLDYIEYVDSNFSELKELLIVDDLTNSVWGYGEEDYVVIINELKRKLVKYNKVKHAVIVNDPIDTALSFIYQYTTKELKNYTFMAFCTFEAGRNWIMKDLFVSNCGRKTTLL